MNAQLTDSEAYTSLTGALDRFLNLEPLAKSIEGVLEDYRPAAYAIAFVLLSLVRCGNFSNPRLAASSSRFAGSPSRRND